MLLQPSPWKQLKHLDCQKGVWLYELLEILSDTAHLEIATVSHNTSSRQPLKACSIELEKLRSLSITSSSADEHTEPLDHLRTPTLVGLDICVINV